MINSQHKSIAQKAMEIATKNGCRHVRISVLTANNNSFEYRNTQLDNLHQSTENKLYIELYVDNKYGSFSTNRIKDDNLEDFILQGVKSTQFLAEDKCQQLPDSSRYFKGNGNDLDSNDTSYNSINPDEKIQITRQSVEEIYESDERIISTTGSFSDCIVGEYMIASNGLEVESTETSFSLTTEVSLKTDGHARTESYWYDSAIYWNDLQKTGIGKTALERALRKIGQKKVKSGRYNMLLDNTIASRLLSPLIGAMMGGSLQQKNSFLIDKLGHKITSEKLTLVDSPHIKRAFGARWYDGEGVATEDCNIIENGVLNTYFIDTYNSLKMDVKPTIASPSIICMKGGSRDFNEILASMNKGIWVTGFNGGNSNSTTGDFSFGVEGFLVENGIATTPIGEMNITGNILDLWSSIEEVGNDPRTNSRWRLPSILFNDISFSGL